MMVKARKTDWCLAVAITLLGACSATVTGTPDPNGSGGVPGSATGSGGSTAGAGTGGGTATGTGGGTVAGTGGGTVAGTGGGTVAGTGGIGGATVFPPGGPAPAVIPIRRLTNVEYTAAVNDLFPGFTIPPPALQPDRKTFNFLNISSSQLASGVLLENYETAAQMVALGDTQSPQMWTGVVADPTKLTGCAVPAMTEMACTQPYLFGLAKRAYRRPLTDTEKTALWGLFSSNPTGNVYKTRLALAIEGILISPNFLFRPEFGDTAQPVAAGVQGLTPWELATRVSFFINGSVPDAALTAAADSKAILQPAELRTQVTRLMAMPRSQSNLVKMHELWLGIDGVGSLTKNQTAFPTFTSLRAVEMGQETRAFIQGVMFAQSGTFADLLLAPYTFANTNVAAFYGVAAPAGVTQTAWGRIDLNPAQRAGILTQPSLLATLAKDSTVQDLGTAIIRGKFVLQQLLCRTVMSPNQAILDMFPGPLPIDKTVREQAAPHEATAVCAGCHMDIDPLGLPFEHYDMIGKWRDTDRNMTLDVSGRIADVMTRANPVNFNGVPELAKIITERPETRTCYLQQWFQFAHGKLVTPGDQPFLTWMTDNFASDKKLVDLVADIVTSNSFRQLKVGP